jgi:hypothetical protein
MPTSVNYGAGGKVASTHTAAEKSDSDIAKAQATSRLSSTAGSGLGAKGRDTSGMPKPGPGEDSMSPSYRERVRKWSEGEAQRKAFK